MAGRYQAKSLSCPNCGGPVELRGFAHTLTSVCPQCLSVLDASTPEVQILQTVPGRRRLSPRFRSARAAKSATRTRKSSASKSAQVRIRRRLLLLGRISALQSL